MFNVLIIDDDTNKVREIYKTLEDFENDNKIEISSGTCINDAKMILEKQNIDILILDLVIPRGMRDCATESGGADLLHEIFESRGRFSYPQFVVSLSVSEDATNEFMKKEGLVHKSIVYSSYSDEWKKELVEYTKKCLDILQCRTEKRNYKYDVAVVCAMKEELDPFLELMDEKREIKTVHNDFVAYEGYICSGEKKISVIAAYGMSQGFIVAATVTTKIIADYIPRYIAMIGIAAGFKDKVNFGDVVVATRAWNYNAGKEIVEDNTEKRRNEIRQIDIEAEFEKYVETIAADKMKEIKEDYVAKKVSLRDVITWNMRIHRGLVATGSAVIANKSVMDKIASDQSRDVLAVEMEIFGFYSACHWAQKPKPLFVALKSICDFGDTDKDDRFHEYASYTSARVLDLLIRESFVFDM